MLKDEWVRRKEVWKESTITKEKMWATFINIRMSDISKFNPA